jgi:hypothetical protein
MVQTCLLYFAKNRLEIISLTILEEKDENFLLLKETTLFALLILRAKIDCLGSFRFFCQIKTVIEG